MKILEATGGMPDVHEERVTLGKGSERRFDGTCS